MQNTTFDKIFRDNEGNVVVAQKPNLPLILWIVATLLKLVITTGVGNTVLDAVAFGSLFTWAWLELFQGVNYFRRGLGLVVLIGVIASRIAGIYTLGSFGL
ncbi:hypothetical protein BV378_33850 [Nostoc sp. RF31YmG]|jgi:hypothetical protein|nr:hypothetical protein BV378_33850 [Nostoc sp. RF31YmG]